MTERKDLDLKKFCELLEEEREGLLELSSVSKGDRKPVMLDQQGFGRLSRMDAMQAQEMSKALNGRRQGRLLMIDAALARIDEGQYGFAKSAMRIFPSNAWRLTPSFGVAWGVRAEKPHIIFYA